MKRKIIQENIVVHITLMQVQKYLLCTELRMLIWEDQIVYHHEYMLPQTRMWSAKGYEYYKHKTTIATICSKQRHFQQQAISLLLYMSMPITLTWVQNQLLCLFKNTMRISERSGCVSASVWNIVCIDRINIHLARNKKPFSINNCSHLILSYCTCQCLHQSDYINALEMEQHNLTICLTVTKRRVA